MKKKKNNKKKWIIGIITTCGLLGGAVYLWKTKTTTGVTETSKDHKLTPISEEIKIRHGRNINNNQNYSK